MGKVRQYYIKKIATDIFEEYSALISDDFENNKNIVNEAADISSKTLRNRIAGYLITLKKNQYRYIESPFKQIKNTSNKHSKSSRKQRRRWVG